MANVSPGSQPKTGWACPYNLIQMTIPPQCGVPLELSIPSTVLNSSKCPLLARTIIMYAAAMPVFSLILPYLTALNIFYFPLFLLFYYFILCKTHDQKICTGRRRRVKPRTEFDSKPKQTGHLTMDVNVTCSTTMNVILQRP